MVGILFHNNQFQVTVVDKDMTAHIEVVYKVGIRNGDTFAGSLPVGIAYHFYTIACLEGNRLVKDSRTHFGTLRIHEDSDAVGNRTHIGYQLLETFAACMSRIHTYYVQTCVEQLFYKINIATLIGNRCNDFCLFQ